MNVLVTGSTGFIGQHLVPLLLQHGHSVVVVLRDEDTNYQFDWLDQVDIIYFDIHHLPKNLEKQLDPFGSLDALIHLAWGYLPNYSDLAHFEIVSVNSYIFIKRLVQYGVKQVLVTGTCLEYGFKSGALVEVNETNPTTPYGFAKDSLRRSLEFLSKSGELGFRLQWLRLFYTYGDGQNPRSLLSQLNHSIETNQDFNMSLGEQLRDYLPIESVVSYILKALEHVDFDGILNICKGTPVSVRNLVEQKVSEAGANIKINLGVYPYQNYEPMAFWGDSMKLKALLD